MGRYSGGIGASYHRRLQLGVWDLPGCMLDGLDRTDTLSLHRKRAMGRQARTWT